MNRRDFLISGGIGCTAACLGLSSALVFSGCSKLPIIRAEPTEDRCLIIHADVFLDPKKTTPEASAIHHILVRTEALPYDILVVQLGEQQYQAIYLQCTHQDQPLGVHAKGLVCPAHGSQFQWDGQVLAGPALTPLKQFKVETLRSNQIKIHL